MGELLAQEQLGLGDSATNQHMVERLLRVGQCSRGVAHAVLGLPGDAGCGIGTAYQLTCKVNQTVYGWWVEV